MNREHNSNILIVSEETKVDDRDDFLGELNKSTYLPRLRIYELQVDRSYLIEDMVRKTTKFGDALLTTLFYDGDRFSVFLPKRYCKTFTDEKIAGILNRGNIQPEYKGGKYHELEFC